MKDKQTQKIAVLEYIQKHGSITPIEALKHIGSFRLGARIYDLKQDGYDIINLNKTGNERYAKYKINSKEKTTIDTDKLEKWRENVTPVPSVEELTGIGVVQVSPPCPKCGSYYRRNGVCNVCKE